MESAEQTSHLRQWLVALTDSGRIPGLCWLNDERTKIKIPFKHHKAQDWTESDGLIFKEWAMQKGRFQEGTKKEDYTTWKGQLRNALNKSQDFRYLEDESRQDRGAGERYRVYELVQRPDSARNRSTHNSGDAASNAGQQQFLAQGPSLIPAAVENMTLDSTGDIQEELPSDLQNIHSSDILRLATDLDPMSVSFESFGNISMSAHHQNEEAGATGTSAQNVQGLLAPSAVDDVMTSFQSITFDENVCAVHETAQTTHEVAQSAAGRQSEDLWQQTANMSMTTASYGSEDHLHNAADHGESCFRPLPTTDYRRHVDVPGAVLNDVWLPSSSVGYSSGGMSNAASDMSEPNAAAYTDMPDLDA